MNMYMYCMNSEYIHVQLHVYMYCMNYTCIHVLYGLDYIQLHMYMYNLFISVMSYHTVSVNVSGKDQ